MLPSIAPVSFSRERAAIASGTAEASASATAKRKAASGLKRASTRSGSATSAVTSYA
jgi:hypothetical protein